MAMMMHPKGRCLRRLRMLNFGSSDSHSSSGAKPLGPFRPRPFSHTSSSRCVAYIAFVLPSPSRFSSSMTTLISIAILLFSSGWIVPGCSRMSEWIALPMRRCGNECNFGGFNKPAGRRVGDYVPCLHPRSCAFAQSQQRVELIIRFIVKAVDLIGIHRPLSVRDERPSNKERHSLSYRATIVSRSLNHHKNRFFPVSAPSRPGSYRNGMRLRLISSREEALSFCSCSPGDA